MLRLYVKYTIPDARAKAKKRYFESLGLKNNIGAVRVVDCYTIDSRLDRKQIQKAKTLLANPLMQETDVSIPSIKKFDYAIEIGFLPGVTDNVGNTAKETLADGAKVKFKDGQNVYSSQVFFVSFNTPTTPARQTGHPSLKRRGSSADIQKIADSLYNPLIQRATIKSHDKFKKGGGLDMVVPKVKLSGSNKVAVVDLNIGDNELTKLGKLGILGKDGNRQGPLSLSLDYLKVIRDYFKKLNRKPTDVELETLAQTWSEHCKHTIFADPMDELEKGIYKTYIKGATEKIRKSKGRKDFCVSVFTDNAGGIIFDKDHIVCHKVETHNTPSALDPFGGSITGIGGVNRDVLGFGLGSKPIANFYGFCLADPNDKTKLFRDKELKNSMLSARRIMEGVVAGINSGGNQSGIPTPLGFLNFDPKYRGKPLVFAGTLGLSPKKIGKRLSWQKQVRAGDLIVMVGGRVGADGIHGATFSSEGLNKDSPATAVQIGDPITQKKLSDAIVKEARAQNLYNSITDCGAGGLSSAVGEMAGQAGDPLGSSRAKPSSGVERAKSRGGCEVYLNKVPLKYPGLAPWQIWISESQERMVLAVPKNRWNKFEKLMQMRGVEATIIGQFTKTGKCVAKYGGKTVLDIEMDFLHDGRPIKHQQTKKPQSPNLKSSVTLKSFNLQSSILNILARPNIASAEFVSQQYDHEVGGGSVLKPLQGRGKINSEAAVIKPVGTSKKALALSFGLHPSYSEIDPYNMAACSIDSAVRAAIAAGANVDYLALLDNFCWCSPQDPKRLWQLKEAARACFDVAVVYGTPFISGKDSMYNDFKGYGSDGNQLKISIPPTLLISAVGVIPEASKAVSLDAKLPGDLLYILGATDDELGGSEYMQMLSRKNAELYAEKRGNHVPHNSASDSAFSANISNAPAVNTAKNYQLYKSLFTANQKNLIASAISCNSGGLIVALVKKLMGGGLGAEIGLVNLPGDWKENYQALFSESQGRILVSIDPKKAAEFEQTMPGNVFAKIGQVTAKPALKITDKKDRMVVNLKIADALKAYRSTFKDY